ncbi:MAG TPA: SLC13 family permease [Jatrophihabitans sp.]|nr:SLC13 family permease [Jatrophihabitans sp.]
MNLELVLGLVLIACCLGAAVVRPFGLSEAVVAIPCALIALVTGASRWPVARHSLGELAATVCFLAAILAFGQLCARDGVFDYLGTVTAHLSRGNPHRLLILVVAFAALVTATLTLDATVVLVTPVVLATTRRLAIPNRPHSYACAHIANSGSLFLPVSNLTNLLAFAASGLSFGRFALAMAVPWVLACVLDWAALRTAFARDLRVNSDHPEPVGSPPIFALVVLGLTVAGFVVTTAVDIAPAWAALAGCLVLGSRQLLRRQVSPFGLVMSASPGFCAFVLCLGVLVAGVLDRGAGAQLRHLIPAGTGLLALLGLALLAGALANLVNNLPTTLALLPLVAGSPLAVLAVLVGVNLGPNATYPGSLATLLWRRMLPDGAKPRALEFHRLGLLATPVLICAVTATLWLMAAPLGLR